MQLNVVFKAVATVICAVGLLAQVNEVSVQYFAYETQSRVAAEPHYALKVPSLSACFLIYDVLDMTRIKNKFKINVYDSNGKRNWTKMEAIKSKVPLKDILQMAPSVADIFRRQGHGCRIKYPGGDYLESFSGNECHRHFNVTKYFHKEYICYKFSPDLKQNNLQAAEYSLADDAAGLIYSLHLNNDMFKNIIAISVYMHDENSFLLYDAMYTQYVLTNSYTEINPTYNTIHSEILEPPFDTNCQRYPETFSGLGTNLVNVQKEILKKVNKLTPSLMLQEKDIPPNVTLLFSGEMKQNRTLKNIYREIYNRQIFKGRQTCTFRCLVSKLSFGAKDHLLFRVAWPDGLEIDVRAVRKLAVIDYVIYICSCIGIWFGISIYTSFDFLQQKAFKRRNEPQSQSERSFRTEVTKHRIITDRRINDIRKILERTHY